MAAQGLARAPTGPVEGRRLALGAERDVSLVRLLVILFNLVAYWFVLYPRGQHGIPWLAGFVTVTAVGYGLYVVVARPFKRFPVLASSGWTALTDGILITLWIHATGDADSPFYLLWYLSLLAITFRYDWRATLIAATGYAASYLFLLTVTGTLAAHAFDASVRVTYVVLAGVLGSLLAREAMRVFEERFHMGRAVDEAERVRALAEASPDSLIIHHGGILLDANRSFCDFMGVARDDALGTTITDLVEPASRELVAHALADHPEKPGPALTGPVDLWINARPGRRLVRMQSRAIDYQGKPALVTVMHDITEERAAQQAQEHALRAEMEVRRLREVDRFKSDFINAAAHELNTPLTPIKLQLYLLKRRLQGTAEARPMEVLERNLDRLAMLVEEMLDVARLESGRLKLEPRRMDLVPLVRETLDTFRDAAQAGRVELVLQVDGIVPAHADPKRITQVLYNLVSNAVKFTPAGGSVTVAATGTPDHAILKVRDTGVGLTPEQRAGLFRPFAQMHRDVVDVPGTGLGLYISKGIVDRHHGELECRSDGPGTGAEFTVRLPVQPSLTVSAGAPADPPHHDAVRMRDLVESSMAAPA